MARWFRMPSFLRQFMRRRTQEIPYDSALRSKHKLTLIYAFCAWNVFGLLLYRAFSYHPEGQEISKELSQGRQFIQLLQLKNPQLYQVSGVTSVRQADVNEESQKES